MSKEQRKTAKSLISVVNKCDWGRKQYDYDCGASIPKHVNTKKLLMAGLSKNSCWYPKKPSQKMLMKHFEGEETCYFTGSSKRYTLCMIDIDCHKQGSLAGALQYAEWLKINVFPNLMYETSTNGNGVHGYIVVDKKGVANTAYNATLKDLAQCLDTLASGFDIEMVEIKGSVPIAKWGEYGEVTDYKCGSLAKFPRDWARVGQIPVFEYATIKQLVESKPQPVEPIQEKKKIVAGSSSGRLIDPEHIVAYYPLAKNILGSEKVNIAKELNVNVDDVATFIAILVFFSKNMNADGTMPTARFEEMWQCVFAAGDCKRAFRDKRYTWIRNKLTELGLIEWQDRTYIKGERACKWQASEELLSSLKIQQYQVSFTAGDSVECVKPIAVGDLGPMEEEIRSVLSGNFCVLLEKQQYQVSFTAGDSVEHQREVGVA